MKNDTGFPCGEPKPKPFEELTFHDGFMFGIVMQDRGLHARGRRMPHTVQETKMPATSPRGGPPAYTAGTGVYRPPWMRLHTQKPYCAKALI